MKLIRISLLVAIAAGAVSFVEQSYAGVLTDWDFQNVGNPPPAVPPYFIHPTPTIGSGTATPLGMNNSYVYPYSPPTTGSQDGEDILNTPGSSTDPTSSSTTDDSWRIRGETNKAGPPGSANGWNTAAPQYTQGAEFDVNTTGFQNITFKYDWFTTNQGVTDQQDQYTTDGIHWTNVGPLRVATPNGFNNGITIDFGALGITGVANNPLFGVRLVSAYDPTYTGVGAPTYTGASGGVYNNTSGNWRFDNLIVAGTAIATPEPSSFIMAGLGLASLGFYGWRRRPAA